MQRSEVAIDSAISSILLIRNYPTPMSNILIVPLISAVSAITLSAWAAEHIVNEITALFLQFTSNEGNTERARIILQAGISGFMHI